MQPLHPHTSVDIPRDWPGKKLLVSFPSASKTLPYNDAEYVVEYGDTEPVEQEICKSGRYILPPVPNGNHKHYHTLHSDNQGVSKAAQFPLDHKDPEQHSRLLRLENLSSQTFFYDIR